MKVIHQLFIGIAIVFMCWFALLSFGGQNSSGIDVSIRPQVWSQSDNQDQLARLIIRNDTGNKIEILGDTAC